MPTSENELGLKVYSGSLKVMKLGSGRLPSKNVVIVITSPSKSTVFGSLRLFTEFKGYDRMGAIGVMNSGR